MPTLTIHEALRATHARLDVEEGRVVPVPAPADVVPEAALRVARGALAEIRDIIARADGRVLDAGEIAAIATAALEATGGAA